MTISLISHTAHTADNGSYGTTVAEAFTSITPPSANSGDLILVILNLRLQFASSNTFYCTNASNQDFSPIATNCASAAGVSYQAFWATFNGTWGEDLAFGFRQPRMHNIYTLGVSSGIATFTVGKGMYVAVFRSDVGSTWSVDVAQTTGTTAGGSPSQTLTGITTVSNEALAIFAGHIVVAPSAAQTCDLTAGSFTGFTGGTTGIQFRNLAGSDISNVSCWQYMPTAGATGSVTWTTTSNTAINYSRFALKAT